MKNKLTLLLMSGLLLLSIIASISIISNVVAIGEDEYIIYETYEDKWTLLIQAHAPRYGSTEGTSSWSYRSKYVIGPWSTTSNVYHSVTLMPEDGRCVARFQLARWVYQYVLVGPLNGEHYEDRWFIDQTFNWYKTINIYGNSVNTCEDDVEQPSQSNGYYFIKFQSRYSSQDRREDNDSDSSYTITVSVSSGSGIALGLTVVINVNGHQGTGTFGLYNNAYSTWTYKYTFGPHHSWFIDYLGTTQYLWTFKLNY
ncbi:MAG: hypothetical protein DRJ30_07190 [Candidatus Methanomethylicota archaeon]|nr:MAG: hypothetical protein DRJ30_07190 [Candidatus Verstraetearchaeota archaeon]